jgi:hypothetical protein
MLHQSDSRDCTSVLCPRGKTTAPADPLETRGTGTLPLGKAVETIGGAIADVAFVGIWGLLTADCDGFVAMGTRTHTGAQLRDLTNGPPLQFADPNEGYRSPSGCGRNSDYVVNTRYIGPGTVLPHPPPGPGGGCFSPETLVLTINDMLVPIKSIEPGDVVMSENVKTGEIVPVIVSKVEKYLASDTLVLNLSNGETIETTPTQHFFHLEDRMPRSGSLLDKAMNSKGVRVATVEARKRTSVVYNLQLQKGKLSGDRYFVGQSRLKVFQKD